MANLLSATPPELVFNPRRGHQEVAVTITNQFQGELNFEVNRESQERFNITTARGGRLNGGGFGGQGAKTRVKIAMNNQTLINGQGPDFFQLDIYIDDNEQPPFRLPVFYEGEN